MTLAITKHTFSVVIIFISFNVKTQILDTNTIWSESNIKYSYVADDTVSIDNKVYHNINSHLDTTIDYSNDVFQTYLIREDGNKVFWKYPFLNEEFLIYDFSLSEGDSIYVTPMTVDFLDSVQLYCDNVDTVEVLGVMRKRLTMITVDPIPAYNTDTEYWYLGIGSNLGLFSSGRLGLPTVTDQHFPNLFCCHKAFDQVYQDSSFNACHGSSASLNKENFQDKINLFPNPTDEKVTLLISDFKQSEYNVSFYNSVGVQVDVTFIVTDNGYEINTSDIVTGVYHVVLQDKNGIMNNRKLIIQH